MAAGLPVIATSVSGIPEIVEDGETGFLFPPGEEEALAERMRWVLSHPREANEMGLRARAFARSFFSTQTYLEGYAKVIEEATRRARQADDETRVKQN
jgi:glycosyltransferase involved in cell wall biosynthesis